MYCKVMIMIMIIMTMVMIVINLLQMWRIRLQVTNNLVTLLHIPKLQSVHLYDSRELSLEIFKFLGINFYLFILF